MGPERKTAELKGKKAAEDRKAVAEESSAMLGPVPKDEGSQGGGCVTKDGIVEAGKVGEAGMEDEIDLRGPVRTVAVTTAGAGVGVIGAIVGITAAALVLEVALPVTLCVWAGGITCGAIGLALGLRKKGSGRSGS